MHTCSAEKLRCRYDMRNITIQRYPRYFLYGVIQKTNNFICLHTKFIYLYLNKQHHRVKYFRQSMFVFSGFLLKFEQIQDI